MPNSIEPVDRPQEDRIELGVYTLEDLATSVGDTPVEDLVDGLLPPGKIAVLVGDSGLGKTPLTLQLGVCVAGGRPFLGRATKQGPVLYCAGEGDPQEILGMATAIVRSVSLGANPEGLYLWSPYWSADTPGESRLDDVLTRAARCQASVVVIDTLRVFVPEIEEKAANITPVVRKMREASLGGTSWVFNHHRRKPSRDLRQRPDLEEEPQVWLVEAAGSNAIITQFDVRLGLDTPSKQKHAELVLGGYVRGRGLIAPVYVVRRYEEGDPVGFTLLSGEHWLSDQQRQALGQLPSEFRYSNAKEEIGGNSDSNTSNFLKKCIAAGLVRRTGTRTYHKMSGVEM